MKYALFVALLVAGSVCAQDAVYHQNPAWSQKLAGKVNTLAQAGGYILIGDDEGAYALDYGGGKKWFGITNDPVTSVKAVGDDVVVATTGSSIIRYFPNRSAEWERLIPGYVGYDAAMDADRRGVLAGSMDGYVYMFDENGTYAWKHLVGSYVIYAKLLSDRVVAVSDRQVYILDTDGKVRRSLDITGYIRSATISGGDIIVGMSDGTVTAYTPDGNQSWAYNVTGYITDIDGSQNITVGSRDMHLTRLAADGSLIWRINTTSAVVAVKSSGQSILASTADNRVSVYSRDGKLRRYYDTDGKASALAIDGENMSWGTSTGLVYHAQLVERDSISSLNVSIAVLFIMLAAIIVVSRSWR